MAEAAWADLIEALTRRPPRLALGWRSATRAGRDCGWHAHDHLELIYHHRGGGRIEVEDGSAGGYGAGDVSLQAPGRRHHQPAERSGEDWCLHLVLPLRWPSVLPGLVQVPAGALPMLVDDLAGLTIDPGVELPAAAALARDLRAGAVLAAVVAAMAQPVAGAKAADPAVRCRELIERDFARIGLVEELAGGLGLGPDRLRHLFRQRYGHGPRAHLRQVRLHAAQRLLTATPLGLEEVARRCGIGNARQLCDLFRELAGTTPGAWRSLRPRLAP